MLTKKDLVARLYQFSSYYCDIDDIYIDCEYLDDIYQYDYSTIIDTLKWVDDNCDNEIGICVMEYYLEHEFIAYRRYAMTNMIDVCRFAWYISTDAEEFKMEILARMRNF